MTSRVIRNAASAMVAHGLSAALGWQGEGGRQLALGVVADDRRPDIIRFAPAPLYCTFHDCWRAADALSNELTGEGI